LTPTIGRIVHYVLSDDDADRINRRRTDGAAGNGVRSGDVFPAVIVRTFGGVAVNLQVFVDGDDVLWVTSRGEGDGRGSWSWPPRV
jgi:hypothetical protein